MFRQRLIKTDMESDQFMSRVWELPVFSDAYTQLSAVYSGVKDHNRLFRYTLDTAECGVHAVVSRTVPPVVAKFEKPISTLNTIACNQLDKLEHDYPIITRPSEEVLVETKQLCNKAVKPLVDGVSAVRQYGVDRVANAKVYTTEKMDNVKAFGMGKLNTVTDVGTQQVVRVLNTSLGHEVVKNVNSALGVADQLVDTWLPEGEPGEEKVTLHAAVVDKSAKDHDVVLGKAASIGFKVKRRMFARVANRLTNLQLRTKETVDRLNFTVDLIEYSRTSMKYAKDKAGYVWTEINKSEEEVAKELTETIDVSAQSRVHANLTLERKAIATARHLTQKLKVIFNKFGMPVVELPQILQARMEQARGLVHSLADSLSSASSEKVLPKYAIDNLRNYASLLLQTTSWMAEWTRQVPVVGQFIPAVAAVANDDDVVAAVANDDDVVAAAGTQLDSSVEKQDENIEN